MITMKFSLIKGETMKPEDQVTSFKPSNRLKELGVKQDSLWYWIPRNCWNEKTSEFTSVLLVLKDKWECEKLVSIRGSAFWGNREKEEHREEEKLFKKKVSAFTVAELGEMLKQVTQEQDITCSHFKIPTWNIYKRKWSWIFGWEDTEANARAKMHIYLIENGIVKV